MLFDFATLAAGLRYKILTATVTLRPIAGTTTRSADGVDNAAPFSFFNVMGHEPPTGAIGILRDSAKKFKDTSENILSTSEFVVHLVPMRLAEAMNTTAAEVRADVDELKLAGLRIASRLRKRPSDPRLPRRLRMPQPCFNRYRAEAGDHCGAGSLYTYRSRICHRRAALISTPRVSI